MLQTNLPLTALEAVNVILGAIGESPVSALEATEVVDASLALQTLTNTSREVQAQGWHFNTEDKLVINPDVNKRIVLPANTLRADTSGDSSSLDLTARGLRVYNRSDHTYTITEPVTFDLVVMLPFEELPSSAKWYITVKSARRFQDKYMGDPSLHQFHIDDERRAEVIMDEEELMNGDPNMLTSSPANSPLFRYRSIIK